MKEYHYTTKIRITICTLRKLYIIMLFKYNHNSLNEYYFLKIKK